MAALLATRLPKPPGSLTGNSTFMPAYDPGTLDPRAGHALLAKVFSVVTMLALMPKPGAAAIALFKLETKVIEL